jgi:Spx/MgsR family transcriptional regulator
MMQPMTNVSITLYGIPNCETVKKARAWLAAAGVAVQFHDFKKQGVPADLLADWVAELGWERLLNRKGTTWRKLDPTEQAAVHDADSAQALMLAQPSVIKRPVVAWGATSAHPVTVGFDVLLFTEALPASPPAASA